MLFFFNDTATTEIYTLSLHDALPISGMVTEGVVDLLEAVEIHDHDADSRVGSAGRKDRLLHAIVEERSVGQSGEDRKSTRLNSSHANISYAVFCLKKKKKNIYIDRTR